jgi:sulfur-carrier protein adenylyltransferase/sulfurtransferase
VHRPARSEPITGELKRMATTEPIELVRSRIEEIDPADARAELERGDAVVIDTREQHEWDEAHLGGATLVPPDTVADRIESVVPDHSQRVLAYCRVGNRSARAVDTLEQLGYEDVASIDGGIVAWQDAGLPVVEAEGLTRDQRMRYSRHTLLPEVGVEGQLKLLNAKVLLVGAGGLGSPSALYLAAAGIGTLGLVDDDVVDESNLQRQVIHTTARVGEPKTQSAKESIEALNPDVDVVEHRTRLDADNILEILEGYDVIIDGADNFPTRYLLNDASVRLRKPVVSASILAFDGQISTFVPYEGPCYRCLYPTPPPPELAPSCGAAGVLGVMAGVMGLLQANEVIKLVAGIGEPLIGRLLLYDSLGTRFTELKVKRDPHCPICGDDAPEIPASEMGKFPDYEAFCGGTVVG